MTFKDILEKYRTLSFSERDKGDRFARLMTSYLQTDPIYASKFKEVWLWSEFPGKKDLGGTDTGIDLVALTYNCDYWAIQCKCYQEGSTIDKKSLDSFLSTSSRQFKSVDEVKDTCFAHRLWIDTTGRKWGKNAEEAVRNRNPPLTRIGLYQLEEEQVEWVKSKQTKKVVLSTILTIGVKRLGILGILELLLSIINVSIQTVDIVEGFPELKFD